MGTVFVLCTAEPRTVKGPLIQHRQGLHIPHPTLTLSTLHIPLPGEESCMARYQSSESGSSTILSVPSAVTKLWLFPASPVRAVVINTDGRRRRMVKSHIHLRLISVPS